MALYGYAMPGISRFSFKAFFFCTVSSFNGTRSTGYTSFSFQQLSFHKFLSKPLSNGGRVTKLDHVWWHHVQGIPSATISAFGLSLFLKTNEPLIAVLAALAGICSKYILRFRGKHIFNPLHWV